MWQWRDFNERREAFGARLKAARERCGLATSEAAKRLTEAGLLCSEEDLIAVEDGIGTPPCEPNASDLPTLAAIYGCRVSDFFSESA